MHRYLLLVSARITYKLSLIFTVCFILIPIGMLGQNLVPNHDFSTFTFCPQGGGAIFLAPPWYSPNGKTTDFIHQCGRQGNTGVPINQWGYQQPASGNGYAGIRAWLAQNGPEPRNYREYLAVELLDSLEKGEDYLVRFKISVGDTSRYTTDDIGLAFSDSMFTNELILPQTPAIINPSNRVIINTYAWTTVEGRYTATGGEKHIAIGCFKDDSEISLYQLLAPVSNSLSGFFNTAYFYVDDVVVEPCKGKFPEEIILAEDSILCPGEVIEVEAVNLEDATYTWENASTDTLRRISSPGEIRLEVELEGCIKKDSIEIVEEELPEINLGRDTLLCPGEELALRLRDTSINYLWNDGSTSNILNVRESGMYSVETEVRDCILKDSITVSYDQPLDDPMDLDTLFCLQSPFSLKPAYRNYEYIWQDNSTASTFDVTQPGTYNVNIRSLCFEVDQAFYVEGVDCGCVSTISNVFSPNNDGYNDVFLPELTPGVTEYHLSIFDRWGRSLFSSEDMTQGWLGQSRGENMSQGVYFWQLTYTCVNNGLSIREQKQGYITLMR